MPVMLPFDPATGMYAAALGIVCWVVYHLTGNRARVQRVLIIGGGPLAQDVVAEMEARPWLRQKVLGLIEDDPTVSAAGCPWLGSLGEIDRIVTETRPDRVIVALALPRGRLPFNSLLALRLRGVIVEDGAAVYERLTGKVPIEALTPTSLLFGPECRDFQLDLLLARAVSVPVAAVALVLLLPVLVLIALAIKLESPGPVFFVQDRLGRKGRRFRLVKFRTMSPAKGATSEWERDNKTRLTRVGRCLRRVRLDELPQLLNIVKGDMDLVGPRPHPVSNVPLFTLIMRNSSECGARIPYYALRSMVRPGLTGWAQVRYHYANDLEEEIEKMRYDLYYIKHRSAWLDLRILFETIGVVLRGPQLPPASAVKRVPAPPRPPVPALRLAVDETGVTPPPPRRDARRPRPARTAALQGGKS